MLSWKNGSLTSPSSRACHRQIEPAKVAVVFLKSNIEYHCRYLELSCKCIFNMVLPILLAEKSGKEPPYVARTPACAWHADQPGVSFT